MSDSGLRLFVDAQPVPEFETTAFTVSPELRNAKVAIVTTAAIHRIDDDGFESTDTGYRRISRADRDLVLGHWSPNFDRTGFAVDLNVVYPIDRLEEMAADGLIGEVAENHYAFAGNQDDSVTRVRLDSGPAAARELVAAGVDVVLLTPV